jgi:hypothetical protein
VSYLARHTVKPFATIEYLLTFTLLQVRRKYLWYVLMLSSDPSPFTLLPPFLSALVYQPCEEDLDHMRGEFSHRHKSVLPDVLAVPTGRSG